MNTESDSYGGIFCEGDGEYRVYCEICDNFVLNDFMKIIWNHKLILTTFVKRE